MFFAKRNNYLHKEEEKKMAQAEVDAETFTLSKYTSVRVTELGQVEFTVTPTNKLMRNSVVTLSGHAWAGFCVNARDRINKCMHDNSVTDKVTWLYHPNTKFVELTARYFGMQVLLQTLSKRGNVMRDQNIFMDETEWKELDQKVEAISEKLDAIHADKGSRVKPHMTLYKFLFEGGSVEPPVCAHWYYVQQHAESKAMQYVSSNVSKKYGTWDIRSRIEPPMDPLLFMRSVLFTAMCLGNTVVNKFLCPGCYGGAGEGNHTSSKGGCRASGRDPLSEYYRHLEKIVADEIVIDIFYRCWRKLKLPFVDASSMLKPIQTLMQDPKVAIAYLKEINEKIGDLPACMLVKDVCDEIGFEKMVKAELLSMKREGVIKQGEEGGSKAKKLKIDSEEEGSDIVCDEDR